MKSEWKKAHPHEAEIMEQCRSLIKQITPSAEVVLYGSQARGEADAESDYDLLVLVDSPVTLSLERKLRNALLDLELKENIVVSLLVYERSQRETPLLRHTPIYEVISKEGVIL